MKRAGYGEGLARGRLTYFSHRLSARASRPLYFADRGMVPIRFGRGDAAVGR